MRRAGWVALVGTALLGQACDARLVRHPLEGSAERGGAAGGAGSAGNAGNAGSAAGACSATLAERLTVANVTLDVPVRYRRSGYDLVPDDERLALSLDERGWPQVSLVGERRQPRT